MGRGPTITLAGALLAVALVLAAAGVGDLDGALSDWQAFTLGIVQGATELLPISSSGHLILVPWLADWRFLKENDAFNQTFDVALHLGTMISVALYFRHDIARLTRAWLGTLATRRIDTPDERVSWFVAIATVPAILIGGVAGEAISDHLGEPWQIAILLAVFAIALGLADRQPARRSMADLSKGSALLVGFVQCLALMPGVSRSGITITAGRVLGLDRDSAARFSFLLLIPTVFAAVVYTGVKDVLLGDLPDGWVGPFLVGTIAAAGSGLLAIEGLLGFVRRHSYDGFVFYRVIAALVVVLLIAAGVREATF